MLKNFCHNHLKNYSGTLALGLPLLVGLIPQSGDHPLLLAPVMMMAACLLAVPRLLSVPRQDPMLLVLLLLWLIWGLSGLFSPVPFPSKVTWLVFGALPLSALIARLYPVNGLNTLIAGTGLILALAAIKAAFIDHVQRPDLMFDDTNLLGLFLVLAVFASLSDRAFRSVSWIVIPVLVIGLIVTESRTSILALAGGLVVWAWLTPRAQRTAWLTNRKVWGLAGLLLVILVAASLGGLTARWADLGHGAEGRIAIWSASLNMAGAHPVTGVGLGIFHLVYPPYRLAGDDSLGLMTHMEPLQSAVESGWTSALLIYGLFGLALARLRLAARQHTLTPDQLMAAAILAAIFVAMHLTYPLHSSPFLIMLGVALARTGLNKAYDTTALVPATRPSGHAYALAIPLAITLALMLWISIGVLYSLLIVKEAKTAFHLRDMPRYQAAMDDCLSRADRDFPDCKIMAARVLIPQPIDGGTAKAISYLDDAERISPLNPEIPFLRAEIKFLDDPHNLIAIRPHLEESLKRNPAYWPARKLLITLLLLHGQKDQARAVFEAGTIYPYAKPTRSDMSATRLQLENAK